MLAVQRPSMGSSKPPNLDMPFGYSFDNTTSNYPFPSPTAPAPGTALLDDNESKFLDSFFDGVGSDQINFDFFNNGPDGSELGLGWDELPPTFMGTTSSFGQQPHPHQMPEMTYGDMNSHMNAGPSIHPATTADVLEAATLLQNGSNGRSQSASGGPLMVFGRDISGGSTNGQPRAHSMSQAPHRSHHGFPQRPDEYMRDPFINDLYFGSQNDGSARRSIPHKVDIRWGSDAGFGTPQGFIPPASQENVVTSERSHIHAVENAFSLLPGQMPSSTDSTRPSSPIVSRDSTSHARTKSVGDPKVEEDLDARPRKRRKSKYQEEVDEDEEEPPVAATPKQSIKKKKPTKKGASDSPVADSEQGHKRRKSTAASAKATRENLTEDQKRENHIKSEQKRRTLIREGFEDLGELVPGLRGGGFSKSAVLIMAADWLEDLIQGNEVLQERLNQMEGR